MVKWIVVGLICATLLALVACSPVGGSPEGMFNPPNSPEVQDADISTGELPSEGYALYGATVTVVNVYPGWSGSAPLTIVNGNDQDRIFHLSLQQPGESIKAGYQPLPERYFTWVVVEDTSPRVAKGATRQVSVTLSAPYNFPAEMKGKNYEVRILVEDWSQSGFIQLALQQKWLITFAE